MIDDTYSPNSYSTNGSTTVFPITNKFWDDADIVVTLRNNTTLVETPLRITTDYTLSGGDGKTGSLTTKTTYASGYTLLIERATTKAQTVDLTSTDDFDAESVEDQLDKTVAMVQEISTEDSLTVKGSAFDLGSVDFSLPTASAGKAIKWNDDGDGLENSTYDPDTAQAAAEAAQVAAEAAQVAAEIAETNAETAESNAQAYAAAAASAAAEGLYNQVITKEYADSPIVPLLAEEGALYKIDTSGGNVVVNLSELSTYAEDMKFAFVKTTSDSNTLTINRGGSDTINGGSNLVISEQYVTYVLVGDESASAWTSAVQAASALQAAYPIGSIYMNASVSTNPATLLGFGTWSAFGAGKMLVGLDSGDTDFDTVEETGGAKEVTLTAAQSGLPAHNHGLETKVTTGVDGTVPLGSTGGASQGVGYTQNNSAQAAAEAHPNLPPYIVVYMWKRTA